MELDKEQGGRVLDMERGDPVLGMAQGKAGEDMRLGVEHVVLGTDTMAEAGRPQGVEPRSGELRWLSSC